MKVNGRWVDPGDDEEPPESRLLTAWRNGPGMHTAAVVTVVFLLVAWIAAAGAWWLLVLLVPTWSWAVAPRRAQRRERARLIRDAHGQHDALMRGGEQDAWAYFGHFQPAAINGKIDWCAPPEAFPTVSRVANVVPQKPAGRPPPEPVVWDEPTVVFNTVVPRRRPRMTPGGAL